MKNLPKELKDKALKALKRAKNKTIDVASDIISAPARMRASDKVKMSNEALDQTMLKRRAKSPEPDSGDQSDPLFRERINAIHETFDRREEKQKQAAAISKSLEK